MRIATPHGRRLNAPDQASRGRDVPGRREDNARHGQPEHTRALVALQDVRATGGEPHLEKARRPLHAEARKLARRRGDRAQRADAAMPGPKDRDLGGAAARNVGMGEGAQQARIEGRLAVQDGRCENQARFAVPGLGLMTCQTTRAFAS